MPGLGRFSHMVTRPGDGDYFSPPQFRYLLAKTPPTLDADRVSYGGVISLFATRHHRSGRLGPRRAGTIPPAFEGIRFASIGPVTSSTLRELGLHVDIEAKEFTIPGLVDAILHSLSGM